MSQTGVNVDGLERLGGASARPEDDIKQHNAVVDQAIRETSDSRPIWKLEEDLVRVAGEAEQDQIRVAGDAELIEILRADGFSGPRYDDVVSRLLRYAFAVMEVWIPNGQIFVLVAKLGWPVFADEAQRDRLHRDRDEVNGIAADAIASAFVRFDQNALKGGGWDPTKGTRLTTYFLGAVIQSFPNAYRKWAGQDIPPPSTKVEDAESSVDPAVTLIQNHDREVLLSELTGKQRPAVEMTELGYTQAQIATHLGTTERAVEGLLRRSRIKLERYNQ